MNLIFMMDQSRSKYFSCLFPAYPRDFPYRRSVRILFRTVHILAAGVLLGGYIFNQPSSMLEPWLWGTVISGLLMLATDIHASLAVIFEVRGMAVIIKTVLLFLATIFWEKRVLFLILALVMGVISSHMPKRYRHRLLFFQKQIVSDQRSG